MSERTKQVPELTISDECKYCAESEPEWSPYANCWIHRRPTLDKRCTRKILGPIGEPAPAAPEAPPLSVQVDDLQNENVELLAELAALEAENARLREALVHLFWMTHKFDPRACDACLNVYEMAEAALAEERKQVNG